MILHQPRNRARIAGRNPQEPARRVLLAALSAAAVAAALPALAEGTWLDALMRRLAAIPARQADFTEEKHLAALQAPLVSRGRLVYRRPDHLEQITLSPRPETVVIDGDRLSIATGGQPARTMSLAAAPALAGLVEGVRGVLAGDLAGLQRFYRIEAQGGPAAWRLILTPSGAPLARVLRGVVLDGAATDIRTVAITQANGDTQILRITP